jgi:hypothetical protein
MPALSLGKGVASIVSRARGHLRRTATLTSDFALTRIAPSWQGHLGHAAAQAEAYGPISNLLAALFVGALHRLTNLGYRNSSLLSRKKAGADRPALGGPRFFHARGHPVPSNDPSQRGTADRKPGASPCLLESYGRQAEGFGPQGGDLRSYSQRRIIPRDQPSLWQVY